MVVPAEVEVRVNDVEVPDLLLVIDPVDTPVEVPEFVVCTVPDIIVRPDEDFQLLNTLLAESQAQCK